jgi:hypothetical protein
MFVQFINLIIVISIKKVNRLSQCSGIGCIVYVPAKVLGLSHNSKKLFEIIVAVTTVASVYQKNNQAMSLVYGEIVGLLCH